LSVLKSLLIDILKPMAQPLMIDTHQTPFVILVVGINGSGKTTTIGKLAKHFQHKGKKVMLAAGDTFRAAAIEQLEVWGVRNQIPVISQQAGSDTASVIFDALQSATAKGVDILIADTAGRLHTQHHLMEELKKVKRVMGKISSTAPHEILLVLDAGIGQNALVQAKKFTEALNITGLVLTKLDGTAKGGIIFTIADTLKIPIRYIGIGEGIDDLKPFEPTLFVEALFSDENDTDESVFQG
jgi:fused signal recognition particle receptor